MASQLTIQQEQANNFLGPVGGALGGLPVAERASDYFAVYTGAGGTGPEIIDQTAIFINYLVDSNGTLSQPSREYASLQNLIQNFEVGTNAIIRNNTGATVDSNIFAKHKVTGIGRQVPLLYSATGSTAGANVSNLDFDSELNQPVPSMLGSMIKTPFNLSSFTNFADITGYNSPTVTPDVTAATLDNTNGTYEIISNGVDDITNVQLQGTATFSNSGGSAATIVFRIIDNADEILVEQTYVIPAGAQNFSFPPFFTLLTSNQFTGDPEFRVQVRMVFGSPSLITVNNFQFRAISQSPQAGFVQPGTPFWEQGSNDSNFWVTASVDISANYGNIQNSDPVTSLASANDFNLSDIDTPFIPRVGDRIRFEYNPETDFIIYEIITPDETEDGRLRLRLNARVPSAVNKNNFILHRVDVNDPVYIIFDVKKRDLSPAGEAFQGVILPEFPSQKLKENIDDLILGLREKGILPQIQ